MEYKQKKFFLLLLMLKQGKFLRITASLRRTVYFKECSHKEYEEDQANSLIPYPSHYNTKIREPTPPLAQYKYLIKPLDLTQDQRCYLSSRRFFGLDSGFANGSLIHLSSPFVALLFC